MVIFYFFCVLENKEPVLKIVVQIKQKTRFSIIFEKKNTDLPTSPKHKYLGLPLYNMVPFQGGPERSWPEGQAKACSLDLGLGPSQAHP